MKTCVLDSPAASTCDFGDMPVWSPSHGVCWLDRERFLRDGQGAFYVFCSREAAEKGVRLERWKLPPGPIVEERLGEALAQARAACAPCLVVLDGDLRPVARFPL